MEKYLFISCAMFLNGVLAHAQATAAQNQQLTSGVVGITAGQTARWNVLYPTSPDPILQPICSVDLTIADDQGNILKTTNVSQFTGGKITSLAVNGDTDLTGRSRVEIYAMSVAPVGCNFIGTLELIDNTTQRTVVVAGSKQTHPALRPNWLDDSCGLARRNRDVAPILEHLQNREVSYVAVARAPVEDITATQDQRPYFAAEKSPANVLGGIYRPAR